MNIIMSVIRTIMGWVLKIFDWLTRPDPVQRSSQQQASVEKQLESMAVYEFDGWPFCLKVRRSAHKLNLPMEYRNVKKNEQYRRELEEGGGKVQVPCLRIDREDETEWMYESDEIVDFFETKFAWIDFPREVLCNRNSEWRHPLDFGESPGPGPPEGLGRAYRDRTAS